MSAVKCTRFPCDQAYRRGTHAPDAHGDVFHSVNWEGDVDWDADDRPYKWQIRTIAFNEDEPWHVELRVGEESFQFWKLDDARRAVSGMLSAIVCAAEASIEEAARNEVLA